MLCLMSVCMIAVYACVFVSFYRNALNIVKDDLIAKVDELTG